ncbi:MAG: CDP-alcohol phosphatidyltransferase family protein [Chloroflexi bacterium]|nr:CDP-alcohol phosphatidyltransferase family protein [Chloroflexota bacterium]
METWRRSISGPLAARLASAIARTRIHPNVLSVIGLLIGLVAAAAAGLGHLLAAGILVLVSGVFDLLDGAVARASNKTSRFGGVLDSTLDRVGEAALFLGLLVFFIREPFAWSMWGILLVNISLVTSGLVSYIKARAEGIGLACPVGLFTRAERVILLAVGLLLGQTAMVIVLAITAVLSLATAAQRLLYVWQQLRGK